MTQNKNIIHIDISKLNAEIEKLQKELAEKNKLRDNILSLHRQYGIDLFLADDSEIEHWLISFLEDADYKRTDKVIESYAREVQKKPNEVADLVKKALVQLNKRNIVFEEYNKTLKRKTIGLIKNREILLGQKNAQPKSGIQNSFTLEDVEHQ